MVPPDKNTLSEGEKANNKLYVFFFANSVFGTALGLRLEKWMFGNGSRRFLTVSQTSPGFLRVCSTSLLKTL